MDQTPRAGGSNRASCWPRARPYCLALFKLKFLLSFAAFIGIYWAAWGMKFGIGFAMLILLHEMGHFIDIKRRGLPAEMPVFLPGLGAYVRWQALGVSFGDAGCHQPGRSAGRILNGGGVRSALVAELAIRSGQALARVGAVLNLLNLIPIWVLDGGQAVLALSKMDRILLFTACLALWLVLGENMFFLVALGAGYQIFFAHNFPAHSSRSYDRLLHCRSNGARCGRSSDAGNGIRRPLDILRTLATSRNVFHPLHQLFRLSQSKLRVILAGTPRPFQLHVSMALFADIIANYE